MESITTRAEWSAFHHKIRADARAFNLRYGGFECIRRSFSHDGREHVFTRYRDYPNRSISHMRAAIIRERPRATLVHDELNTAAEYRAKLRAQKWNKVIYRRAIRLSLECARAWRLATALHGA